MKSTMYVFSMAVFLVFAVCFPADADYQILLKSGAVVITPDYHEKGDQIIYYQFANKIVINKSDVKKITKVTSAKPESKKSHPSSVFSMPASSNAQPGKIVVDRPDDHYTLEFNHKIKNDPEFKKCAQNCEPRDCPGKDAVMKDPATGKTVATGETACEIVRIRCLYKNCGLMNVPADIRPYEQYIRCAQGVIY